nr:Peptidase A1 domain containing protein [Haemonchus contortus]
MYCDGMKVTEPSDKGGNGVPGSRGIKCDMKLFVCFIVVPFAVTAVHQLALTWNKPRKVFNYGDLEYATAVTIGTPPQEFIVALALNAPVLYVPHPDCNKKPCDQRRKFRIKDSSTFKSGSNETFIVRFPVGGAKFLVGTDTVALGGKNEKGLVIKNMDFGLATQITPSFVQEPFDGVLGFAFARYIGKMVPPIVKAYTEKVIEKPMFTVWLASHGITATPKPGGAITYGGMDDDNCGAVIGYTDLTDPQFYQFKMDGIAMGTYVKMEAYTVTSEFSAWIIGPSDVVKQMAEIAGAKYNADRQFYEISCQATPPAIRIFMGNNIYYVDHTNYIVEIEQDRCMFAMMPDGNPFWTIGLPFIRQYCHIYDIGGKRIGFARPRSSPEPPTKAPEISTQPPQPEPTPHKSGTIISSFTLWIFLFFYVIIHFS